MNQQNAVTFLQNLTTWVKTQPSIFAIALVGSYARNAATEESDVDLVILAQNPEEYLQNTAWTSYFGAVKRTKTECYGRVTSLRVWYQNGLEIEFGFTDLEWAATPVDEGTQRVISDGMLVLYEKDRAKTNLAFHTEKSK